MPTGQELFEMWTRCCLNSSDIWTWERLTPVRQRNWDYFAEQLKKQASDDAQEAAELRDMNGGT